MTDDDKIYFAVTLKPERSSITWNFEEEMSFRYHKLIIQRLLLGSTANGDECNVIVVNTAANDMRIPIAELKSGENRIKNLDLEYYESVVTFTLAEGKGPVHMLGHIVRDDVDNIYTSEDAKLNCLKNSRCL